MKSHRSADFTLLALFSVFALGFAGALLVAVTNPGVAEIMADAAVVHGLLALGCFAGMLYQDARSH